MQVFGEWVKEGNGRYYRETDLKMGKEAGIYRRIIQFDSWERVLWHRDWKNR